MENKILHVSDLHSPLSCSALRSPGMLHPKRLAAGLNYLLRRRKCFKDVPRKLEELAAFSSEQNFDAILCTGDFTCLGLPREFEEAANSVKALTESSPTFCCIPGNHDIYLENTVSRSCFDQHFGSFYQSDLPDMGLPYVKLIGDTFAAVAIESCRPNPCIWHSWGCVPQEQLEALGKLEDAPELKGRFLLFMTHFNLDLHTKYHDLQNAVDLCTALKPYEGHGAILHGHMHHRAAYRVAELQMPILCCGSSTYAGREGGWSISSDLTAERIDYPNGIYTLSGEKLDLQDLSSLEMRPIAQ